MELLENLGRRILEKREKERLGLREAAKKIGITHATLSRVEKVSCLTWQHIKKFTVGSKVRCQ